MFTGRIFSVVFLAALALSPRGNAVAADGGMTASGGIAQLTMHDGLAWVQVECGAGAETRTLNFVVDTGAARSCIDVRAARELGLKMGTAISVAGVDGMATGYDCGDFHAEAAGMALPRQVLALDLSGPSHGCWQRIDGLIGADFFIGKVMRLDCARGVLSRAATPAPGIGVPLRAENGVLCAQVAVDDGTPRWTRVDTGCAAPLYWCEGADCARGGSGATVALGWLTGKAVPAEVRIGGVEIRDVPVRLRAQEIYPGEAGLLGNGLLSRQRVTIDGIGKRLVLE